MGTLIPGFDWLEVARIALTSRRIDELEEKELAPQGYVTYQFSAGGHELGQALFSQLLDRSMDAVGAYYRSRPLMLGLGLTIEEALASDMARQGGLSAGRDVGVVFNMPRRGKATVLPMAGDVGSQYTPAAGWAQAIRYRMDVLGERGLEESIVIVFGGEGSVATNGFWSSLTMVTTLSLPMLFVIEDNGYAISVQNHLQTPGGNIAANLASFSNLTTWNGNGTLPTETAELVLTAVNHMRSGQGPGLLRLTVPRLSGHSSMDNQAYKSEEILREERSRDPLLALKEVLVRDVMDEDEWEKLESSVSDEVTRACQAAKKQPQPARSEVERYVFSEAGNPQKVGGLLGEGINLPPVTDKIQADNPLRVNMVDAIRQTLDTELSANPRCLVFGEDVGQKGGVHTATMGLLAKHGKDRVFDTGLSEEGIIGRAVGLALAGLVPVPEIQFRKYADPATEQLNNLGTLRWRTANRFGAPVVVRVPGGYGRKIGDPWHSVTGEATFAHAVGWHLAFPSNAEDAVGLLRTALRGNDPVIFFEHRALLDGAWSRRPYPGDDYAIPFGRAKTILEGDDLTVVTWGAMVEKCEMAANQLMEDMAIEASIELIDLRTIIPWDKDAVLASLGKTGKCLIVHEDIGLAGFGAEIAAILAQEAFFDLDGPVERITAPSVPVPFNLELMTAVVPGLDRIKKRMEDLLTF